MDAGARGRRLLQRREYKAKVSEFVPKELEDQYTPNGELVSELDIKKTAGKVLDTLKKGAKKIFSGPIMRPNITKDQHLQKIRNSGGDPSHWENSYKPEGEMIEANSAQQKAMHDAKIKRMEDEKVAKKTKKEEVQLEAKVDQGKDDASKVNTRNQRAFGNRRGSKGGGHTGDDMEARRYNTEKGRGVKMRGKKDKTPVNYHKRDRDKAVDELLGRTKKKEPTYLQKKGRQVDIKRKIKNKEGIFAEDMKEDFYRKKYDVKDGGYKKTNKMTKSNKRAGDSKAQNRELHIDLKKYKLKKLKTEGSLHKWFKGSKSKDGKGGWVNVVTGGTCASDKPGEGTPKCVSSSKRASMTKAERLSASRRKKKADPGQQSKSGAAKPTYVATDKKKKVDEMNQGPSTPVGNYDGKIMPKFGAGRIGNIRLKGGKSIADLLKKV